MEMEDSQVPEICRSNLTLTVLKLIALFGDGGGNVHLFEFIERPTTEALDEALLNLDELGAIRRVEGSFGDYSITTDGECMVQLDHSPEISRMILEGIARGIQSSIIALASILVAGSYVFYRSGSEDAKAAADLAKATFVVSDDETMSGDWLTILNVYKQWEANGKTSTWCRANFIVQKTLKMADKIAAGIKETLLKLDLVRDDINPLTAETESRLLKIAICKGFFKNVALSIGGGANVGLKVARFKDRMVLIHPTSVLSMMRSPIKCVVYDELIRTSRYFIRGVTTVDVETIIDVSPRFAERIRLRELTNMKLISYDFTGIGPAIRSQILGFKGKNLQEIEKTLNVTLEIVSGENTVRLWTSGSNMQTARLEFIKFLEKCKVKIGAETLEVSIPTYKIRSVVSGGCHVSMILGRNEFRKAIIRGLPADFPWTDSKNCIALHAKVDPDDILEVASIAVSSDGKTSWGYVLCINPKLCIELIQNLDKTCISAPPFNGCQIIAHPCGEAKIDAPIISDSTVKVTWNTFPFTGRFTIQFREQGYALIAQEKFLLYPLIVKNQQVQLFSVEGASIKFCHAPLTADEDDIRRTLSFRTDIEGWKEVFLQRVSIASSNSLSTDTVLFSSLFTECGEVLNMNIFPTNEKNGRCKAFITFADHAAAEVAVQRCDGTVAPFGNPHCVLRVVADISCLYRVPHFMYPKVSELLKTEVKRLNEVNDLVHASGPLEKGLKGATVKIETSQYEALGAAKVYFDGKNYYPILNTHIYLIDWH